MGKSNRIRLNRANDNVKSLGAKNKGKGMPSWALSLIAIVMTAAILLSAAAILLSANGVFGRIAPIVSSDNFSVSANMMSYFAYNEYSNFVSSYESYLTTNDKDGMLSYNPSVDMSKQKFGGSGEEGKTFYDEQFLGEFEGTWRDYFIHRTTESVKELLRYCEYAKANGIEIDDKDKKTIEANLATYDVYAEVNEVAVDQLFSQQFGSGISESDVEECMKISILASKGLQHLVDTINKNITKEEVDAKFEENKLDYLKVDYLTYSVAVNYDEITVDENKITEDTLKALNLEVNETNKADKKADIDNAIKAAKLEAYKEKVAVAVADANALKAMTDADSFKAYLYKKAAKDAAKTEYDKAKSADISEADLSYFLDKIAEDIAKELVAGKTEAAPVYVIDDEGKHFAYEKEITADAADKLNTAKVGAFTTAKKQDTSMIKENQAYTKASDGTVSELTTWLFADERKVGEVKADVNGDGADGNMAFAEATNGKYEAKIYFITNIKHPDTTLSKNFTYMAFSTEAEANKVVELLKDVNTLEAFKKVAKDKKVETTAATDYEEGVWGEAFDAWIFADTTVPGTVTGAPIKVTVSEQTIYVLAIYEGTGNEAWYIEVKNTIADKKYTDELATFEDKYATKEFDYNSWLININTAV